MVTGDAVNTAARLEQAAGSGEVVLGDLTYRLARDQIEVEFMAPLNLKGKAEPVPAYRLVSRRDEAPQEQAAGDAVRGREEEMARLSGTLSDAIDAATARLITVVGDAGVGKSRLIREFATAASEQARLVRGRCLPYGDGITFWPLAEVVREAAGITSEDSPRIATRRIDRLLERARRRRSRGDRRTGRRRHQPVRRAVSRRRADVGRAAVAGDARRRAAARHARRRPALGRVDVPRLPRPPARDRRRCLDPRPRLGPPRDQRAARGLVGGPRLDARPARAAERSGRGRIVEELLGSLDESIRQRIATAAEGNPLYVEQIVSMLVETGAIQRGLEGWVARQGSDQLQIPPTVQALVASRLDALKTEERAVVDPASVIGLSFALDAISELVDEEILPRSHLATSTCCRTSSSCGAFPKRMSIYRFGHQIIRDTAYGSLLKRSRATLHERFVTWAERVNRERGRELEFEEILGYHLEQAYRYRVDLGVIDDHARSVADRAAAKLSSAGRRALARSDIPAAASLLARATALLPELDPLRIELLLDLSEVNIELGTLEAAAVAVSEARGAAAQLADERLLARTSLSRIFLRNLRPERHAGRQ